MTDNEIMKALECCKGEAIPCSECIYADFGQCQMYMADDALKLINRKKKEIEKLQRHNKEYGFCNLLGNVLVYSKNLKDYNDMRKGLKSEAYKEFAERLKEKSIFLEDEERYFGYAVKVEDVDDTLKELTEKGDKDNA